MSIKEYWREKLIAINPFGAKLIEEDGSIINFGELMARARDRSTALKTIPLEHSKIHDGRAWSIGVSMGALNQGATSRILARTKDLKLHLRYYSFAVSAAPCTISFFENTIVSADGTAITARNRNRPIGATQPADVDVFLNPTVTGNGTLLETRLVTGSKQDGGNIESPYEEWVLLPNTNYMFAITNNVNQNSDFTVFNSFWYSEER